MSKGAGRSAGLLGLLRLGRVHGQAPRASKSSERHGDALWRFLRRIPDLANRKLEEECAYRFPSCLYHHL